MIKQAIIPLAGLGTRLLPLTSVIQKELLPLNGKPNLEHIMEECIEAGINQFIFIVPKNIPTISIFIILLLINDIINIVHNGFRVVTSTPPVPARP